MLPEEGGNDNDVILFCPDEGTVKAELIIVSCNAAIKALRKMCPKIFILFFSFLCLLVAIFYFIYLFLLTRWRLFIPIGKKLEALFELMISISPLVRTSGMSNRRVRMLVLPCPRLWIKVIMAAAQPMITTITPFPIFTTYVNLISWFEMIIAVVQPIITTILNIAIYGYLMSGSN